MPELNTQEQQQEPTDSFLDIDTSNVPEAKVLPEGEVLIQLTGAEKVLSKTSSNPMITTIWEVPGEPTVDDMYHYVTLPAQGQNEKTQIRGMRNLQAWKTALGLPQTGQIDLAALVSAGVRCYAYLTIEEYQGTRRNKIQSLVRRAE